MSSFNQSRLLKASFSLAAAVLNMKCLADGGLADSAALSAPTDFEDMALAIMIYVCVHSDSSDCFIMPWHHYCAMFHVFPLLPPLS